MESNKEPMSKPRPSWNQKFTDFEIILQSGEKLRVHKLVLADNSEVFEAMLTKDMEESNTSKMSLEHFEEDAVINFIQYLYTGRVDDPETVEQLKAGAGPDQYIYKRNFDKRKFNIELLKMADMYQIEDLKLDCTEYLKKTINDDNVMEVWIGAHTLKNKTLTSWAVKHLVDRPKGKTLNEVPGFNETFQSSDHPLMELVQVLADENLVLKGEKDLKGKLTTGEDTKITITVIRKPEGRALQWTLKYSVWTTNQLSKIIDDANKRKPSSSYSWKSLSRLPSCDTALLDKNTTFEQNNIVSDTTLYIWMD